MNWSSELWPGPTEEHVPAQGRQRRSRSTCEPRAGRRAAGASLARRYKFVSIITPSVRCHKMVFPVCGCRGLSHMGVLHHRSLGAWRRWASRRAWRRSWALRWAGRSATPSASRRSPRRCVAWGKMLPSAGVTSGLVRPYAGCSRETNTAITAFNCGSLATRQSVSQHQQQCSDCCLTQHYGGCALQRQVVVPTAAPMAPTFISLSKG